MQLTFNHKTVLVTGAASGIGHGIVSQFLEAGANVFMVDINRKKLDENGEHFSLHGFSSRIGRLCIDITQDGAAQTVVDRCAEAFGQVDVLVNCAGIYPSIPALRLDERTWDNVMNLNVKTVFFLSQAAARSMIDRGIHGNIVNVSSSAGEVARPGVAHYCASKAALNMLTRTLALEWGEHHIRVNAVAPGLVETDTLKATLVTEEAVKEHREKLTYCPLGRPAAVEEIASGVLYLASSQSSFVTGQILNIDGGYSAGRVFQNRQGEK